MSEFATYKGRRIKIGTCENMYYLRADQRHLVEYDWNAENLSVIRFRFPLPDEDKVEPGQFSADRGVRVPGYTLPAKLSGDEHRNVQFTASAGYVTSIPCPEQYGQPGFTVMVPLHDDSQEYLRVGRNGFNGHPRVTWQGYRGGHLVTILTCGACGALHRLDTIEDAQPVIDAFREEAMRRPAYEESSRDFYLEIASRIEAGYKVA